MKVEMVKENAKTNRLMEIMNEFEAPGTLLLPCITEIFFLKATPHPV
jgi:hypothetical protein